MVIEGSVIEDCKEDINTQKDSAVSRLHDRAEELKVRRAYPLGREVIRGQF
jgi:hypothetical protein